MTLSEQLITIAMVILGTALTRFLPFLIFPAGKPTPKYIQYLGKVLPAAVFGLLVVYCLRNVNLFSSYLEAPDASFHCGGNHPLYGTGAVRYDPITKERRRKQNRSVLLPAQRSPLDLLINRRYKA